MKFLVVIKSDPFNGSDLVWNAVRFISQSLTAGMQVRVFLLSDGVDLARQGAGLGLDVDPQGLLAECVTKGAEVNACKTCLERRRIPAEEIRAGFAIGTMPELVAWTADAERVLTF